MTIRPVKNAIISYENKATRPGPCDAHKIGSELHGQRGEARWGAISQQGGGERAAQIDASLMPVQLRVLQKCMANIVEQALSIWGGRGVINECHDVCIVVDKAVVDMRGGGAGVRIWNVMRGEIDFERGDNVLIPVCAEGIRGMDGRGGWKRSRGETGSRMVEMSSETRVGVWCTGGKEKSLTKRVDARCPCGGAS